MDFIDTIYHYDVVLKLYIESKTQHAEAFGGLMHLFNFEK